MLNFLADSYFAFLFWTAFTSFGVCVWYFPLWEMGLSGYEALLLADVLPIIMCVPFIRDSLYKRKALTSSFLIVGLVAYLFPSPLIRFLIVGVSFGLSTLWFASILYEDSFLNRGRFERDINALQVGLILSLVVRMASYSNNPIWPVMNDTNGGWNRLGLIFALVSFVSVYSRKSKDVPSDSKFKKPLYTVEHSKSSIGPRQWLCAALGLGGWLFAIHNLFTESSILGRWTWDGYPNTGPKPVPWGALVTTALSLGFSLGNLTDFTSSFIWWSLGSAGAFMITFYSGWFPFLTGLVLAVYISSITPLILGFVSKCPPGRTISLAFVCYNILVLASVWTVAYEFVPGGPILRERSWAFMSSMMLFIYCGVSMYSTMLKKNIFPQTKPDSAALKKIKNENYNSFGIMWFLVVLSWLVMFWRIPSSSQTPVPYHPKERILTSAIWTIHFDIDNELWSSEQRILEAVRDLEADVMGFLESDTERIIMGNRDWTQKVAEKLDYYVDYGPSPRKHTWGCAMLSKFPILKSSHHLLPSPVGELACAIYATLDVYGHEVDVVISHNGQEENFLDRKLQTTELARLMRESKNPVIFTGYVVTKPFGPVYDILINEGKMSDVDPTDSDRWCQYIAYRGLKRVAYARISRGTITDTEIQAAKFILPMTLPSLDTWKPSYNLVNESHYPSGYHFPTIFRGEGVRGHFYHVFNEPKYYD
ncbi:Protein cwh43 [Smittium mucronatum]|uniref:Protein cwh43 n=1 Tax=Smittium mucronatum TaxID=133383 RepID=A0A1R0GYY5_9FUNG|nr:Protein cwh43 [Smittium mucronatum]